MNLVGSAQRIGSVSKSEDDRLSGDDPHPQDTGEVIVATSCGAGLSTRGDKIKSHRKPSGLWPLYSVKIWSSEGRGHGVRAPRIKVTYSTPENILVGRQDSETCQDVEEDI